jgi:site-specific DNA recombinase
MIATIKEIDRRAWVNKRWTTRKGHERGGKPFTKVSLHKLLTNITYLGKLRYKNEVHAGEHAGIVSGEIWQRVQSLLQRNGRTGGAPVRNRFGALLKGIIRCVPCGCGMSPTHATRNGTKRYRYYVCNQAQKRGWHNCPSQSIPAAEIERFVVDQIKSIGKDPALLNEVIAQARNQGESRLAELETDRRGLERELKRWNAEVRSLLDQVAPGDGEMSATARLADLQERIRNAERRATEIREEVIALSRELVDQREVAKAMSIFDPVWDSLTPREQVRVVQLLVERVDYDGASGKVSITFHPCGIKTLVDELASRNAEHAA